MTLTRIVSAICAFTLFAIPSFAQVIIQDEIFELGYSRTVNDIANGNLSVLKARTATTPTVGVGSLSFSSAASAGANQIFGYFTDTGANVGTAVQNGHVIVGLGDSFSISLKFNLAAVPAGASTYGLRFGIFDDVGSRQTTDLTSGGSSAAFVSNPGYAVFVPLTSASGLNNQISIRQRTTLTAANIFSASADFTQIGSTVGGSYTPLVSGTDYIFNFSFARLDASTTTLTSSIVDAGTLAVMTSGSVVNSGTQLGSFDWFAWRSPQEPDAANGGTITLKQIQTQLSVVPEPSTVTLAGLVAASLFVWRRSRH
jgi:hypothetical protein